MCASWNISFVNRKSIRLNFRVDDTAARPMAAAVLLTEEGSAGPVCVSAAPALAQMGVRCYSLDFRGRGRSAGEPLSADDLDELVADIMDLLTCISDDVGALDVFAVGQGLGVRAAFEGFRRDASEHSEAGGPAVTYGPAASRIGQAADSGAGRVSPRPVIRGAALWAPEDDTRGRASKVTGRLLLSGPEKPGDEALVAWIRDQVGPWIAANTNTDAED